MAPQAGPRIACSACGAPAAAAARFCTECGDRLAAPDAGAVRELRPMTLLFCGIPDADADDAGGAEERGELHAAVLHVATRVAERHGARLVRFLGDGVLAHFGWPAAREDDTPHAAEAALAIRDTVAAELACDGRPLRLRAGIAAGLVMVSDAAGTGDPRHLTILGETVNLAARLQALAAPGEVLVSDSVRRQLAARFALAAQGRRAIRGWAEAVPVWRLLGHWEDPEHAADGSAPRTPLLGRAPQLATLRQLWEAASLGRGATALVLGEPGIGKSRLVAELLEDVPRSRQLRLFAAPQEQGMPLQPLVRWLGRAAALLPEDPPAQRRRKLVKLLAVLPAVRVAPILELMGAVETQGPAPTPQRGRARLLQAVLDTLVAVADRSPVLVVFEDLHWADPTTLDLLGLLAVRVAPLPVLLLATARPGPLPGWAANGATACLRLDPLGEVEARGLMRAVAQDVPVPPETLSDLLRRSEGVPLFLEELTRAVVEDLAPGGAGGGPGARRDAGPVAVPASLQASLLARLERIGGARGIAEAAAAIGREFDPALLAAVLGEALAPLVARLDRLAEIDLLQRQGAGRFRFRHALLQDAALGLMPRDRLRDLHARIAETLAAGPSRVTPQRVAHHWTEAGRLGEAIIWWRRGAAQAMARSAPAEALAQLRRALALLRREPEGEVRLRQELQLELAAGEALLVLQGHGAEETGAAYDRARVLSERLPGRPSLRTVMHGQWSHAWMRGLVPLSLARAEALLQAAAENDDPAGLAIGHSAMAHSQLFLGRFRAAAESAARSLAHHDPTDRARRHDTALQATMISTRCYGAWARMFLGRTLELRQELALTLAAAERSRVPFAIANAGYALGLFAAEHGAEAEALAQLDATARFCAEQELGFLGLAAGALAGLLRGRLEDPAAGLAAVRRAVAGCRAQGVLGLLPHLHGMEAELLALAGDPAAGLTRLAEAEAGMRANGAPWEESPLLNRRAAMLAAGGATAAAEAAWREARQVAQRQDARLFRLQASLGLAAHLARTASATEARGLLADALQPFAGVEEPLLHRARALAELPAGSSGPLRPAMPGDLHPGR